MHYIIHTGPGIGDIIQFLSMARGIKENDPKARVDLLMRGSAKILALNNQILECQNYVNKLYWYSSKDIRQDIKLLSELLNNRYDYGFVRIGSVSGEPSLWIYRIMRLARCKKIVGYGTDKVDIAVDIPQHSHYLERNRLLLNAIGIKGRDDAISIDESKLDKSWLNKLDIYDGDKIVGLSLGTNSMVWKENGRDIEYDVKSWPYEYWLKLTKQLIELGYKVILIGGIKERNELSEKNIVFPKHNKLIDLVGKTSIKESLTIINRISLLVGAEGGMMHCASAVGTTTLTIFGGSDYKIWNPGGNHSEIINLYLECAPCFCTSQGAHCDNHRCLEKITPEMVLDKIIKMIS
ncbi:glycosyltransferase family 9 protein [Eubacterium sp. MSJ-13]|uniref:glycosyltransferase family 9 protein n=1 Tax=Eubacterium sp. MSJ-13 TaxID=2841513 RepID=UPI001C0FA3F3|nr:glycosyltransferase family 9 protein [Eubacterium sp. MSJ-13]MBU5477622.1 glycosyltransferase family 9 protein [Eubacterium sp. MSJ-13]